MIKKEKESLLCLNLPVEYVETDLNRNLAYKGILTHRIRHRLLQAADIEKVLAGIEYPKTKDDLVQYSSQKMSTMGKDLFNLINSLPSRTYRDSADVAVALGELKSGKAIRNANEVKASEQPSRKGGRTAATSSISGSNCKSTSRNTFSKEQT